MVRGKASRNIPRSPYAPGSYERTFYPYARASPSAFILGPNVGRGPKGYRRSDERITEDVCERLTWHGDLDASAIEVHVENGEVTLEGTVESRQAKRIAEDLAESVLGVRDVHNRLYIACPAEGTR